MKKFLLICFAVAFACAKGYAQQIEKGGKEGSSKKDDQNYKKGKVVVGSSEYDLLKAKGLLAHYEFIVNDEGKMEPVPASTYLNKGASTQSSTLTPCDWPPIQGIQPWAGNPTDDATSGLITLPFQFCFYGNNYTQCRVSTNGNIQFPPTNNTGFTSTGFPTATDQMIAPFWGDVDIRGGGRVFYDIYPTYAVFSWDSVGYYNSHSDLRNTFQCVITDGLDPILPPGKNVGFYFGTMQWTTGDASGGANGFPITQPGSPAMVGANAGNNTDFFVIGRYGVPGAAYDGPLGNNDGVSWLDHKKFFFNICPPIGGNQEPISTLIGYCDTLRVCGNDTLYVKNTWIAPEASQTVAVTATATTLGSSFTYSVLPNANGTDIYMIIDGNTAPGGYHTITMTATDNGTPPQSSVLGFVVYVDQNSVSNLNGNIVLTPTVGACPGGSVSASVNLSGTPDSYLWSNNSNTSTTTFTTVVPADSIIFVTITSGMCQKTLIDYIKINPTPVASITGNMILCSASPTTVLTASNTLNNAQQGPYTYNWTGTGTLSANNTMSTTVGHGVYTVTVTNQFGCIDAATATVVVNESPSYSVSTNAISGGSVYCINQDTARIAFHYGTASTAVCGLGTTSCFSPSVITVGTGTGANSNTSNPCPYGNYDKNRREQYLFTAAELQAAGMVAGNISSISFQVNSMNPTNTTGTSSSATYIGTLPAYTVKMKCTPATTLSNFDNNGLVQVYQANFTPTVGINTHNFPQPYIWDGTSSLIVDVCYTRTVALTSTYYTSNPVMPYTPTTTNKTVYFSSDVTPACGNPTGNTVLNRPNIKFGNCLAQQVPGQFNVVVTPTTGVVVPGAKDSVKIDLPSVPATTCYTITVTNPVGGCQHDTVICVNTQAAVTTASFSASTYTVCAGATLTLTASGAETYTMSYIQNGSPVYMTNGTTAVVTPPSPGLNVYSLTATGFCGAAPASYTLGITVLPVANLEIAPLVDVAKCQYSSYNLHAGVGSETPGNTGEPYTYQWTMLPGNSPAPGTNNAADYSANSQTTQTLVISVSGQCANGDKDTVVVKNFPSSIVANIIDSASVCSDSPYQLHSAVSGGEPAYTYNWTTQGTSIGTGSSLNATSPGQQGNYVITLTVTDSCGITHSDDQVINVLPPCNVSIPNIITPNGDGVNDYFKIGNLDKHPNSALTIYDRWGKKVFESPDYQNNWKADGLSDGTFFYTFDVPDDKSYTGFISVFHGK